MLQAVIFDLDGLLVDTETPDWEAWHELYARRGLRLGPEEYAPYAGQYGSWDQLYAALARHTHEDPVALHTERLPRFLERVERSLRLPDGLSELLATLRAREIPCGVASASDREWVEQILDRLAVRGQFRVVVTGHECPVRKPAPDCYLRAAADMGVAPAWCVALEDSATGIQAARHAGMWVVAVPNGITRYQDLSHAHLQVQTFRDLDLARLRQLVSGPL
ncbi:MAG: HAD family phosphatase [Armatimonadetes bacterium]|nr:HAD family phosphatase [Armatimonadota bacterium]